MEVFEGSNEKNTPFQRGFLSYQNRPQGGERSYYTVKWSNQDRNENIRFQSNASVCARKIHHAGSVSIGKYFFYNSKESSCHWQFRTGSTNKDCNSRACASNNKTIICKSLSNVPLAERIPYFKTDWEKITHDQEILSIVKGYEMPFVNPPFQEKVPNLTKNSKKSFH